MTKKQFDGLQVGDIVRHKLSAEGCVIAGHIFAPGGPRHIVVRSTVALNPDEWLLFDKLTGSYLSDE